MACQSSIKIRKPDLKFMLKFVWIVLLFTVFLITAPGNVNAKKKDTYFERHIEAYKKAIKKAKELFPENLNPHDQISDEGEILYKKCLFCHNKTPAIGYDASIDATNFPFDKFEDLEELCFTCHQERMHPGGSGMFSVNPKWTEFGGAPNHFVKPDEYLLERIEDKLTKIKTSLPLDPKTGKITCSTCHNPHERGILLGRADVGANSFLKLRSLGDPLCIICHEV